MQRRHLLASPLALATPAFAQADSRPVLTVAVQKISNSNTLEPPREQSNVGFRLSGLFSETLIGTDWTGDLSAKPELATAWRRVDARTLEFTLRPDVKMHDGRVMTAEDIAFSLGAERLYGSGEASTTRGVLAGATGKEPPGDVVAAARRSFPGFEKVEIVSENTIRFVNRTPDLTLEGRMTQNVGAIFSREAFRAAESWLGWARRPVGSGPYAVGDYRPDVSLMLEAHDEYWGGRPPARRIRVLEVPEVSSRINGLASGEYDFACDIPPDQIGSVERHPRFEVLGSAINNMRIICFDTGHPLLRNPLLRRAMAHAVDRDTIVQALWAGRTEVPKGLQLESFGQMHVGEHQTPRFDLNEAKRLVRESGYRGEPIPYRLLNNYYTGQVPTAQILQEMWRAAGINVQIEMRENWSQVNDRGTQRGIRDWSCTAVFPDPVATLVRAMGPNGELQRSGEWKNEEFNRLVSVLETSTEAADRRAAHARMLDIIEREDPGYIVLHQAATFTAKRRDIRWRAPRGWPLDFRAGNLAFRAS
ncbi:ABC transporter substrate-binding protein [Rhodovarius crocodyli]|uniref:ABC transporter substrate-binding protein n=1 Tax=Rhodovarius crocodyli TaxID=1979269 RepID=A0A437LXH7_9PROT|nr:ABC transporter substrate-binding protein [Rhodovarius crocodyli]RVT90099.1 ABC transporter substrate-binding protein [Rhodovarius crocodyli]